ncbi:hypothetical protein MSSD1_392 [Mycoplasmopsis synoviae]
MVAESIAMATKNGIVSSGRGLYLIAYKLRIIITEVIKTDKKFKNTQTP